MTTALVLSALAVAYLLWSRPAAPAGLPPLSPLPAPLVPPAGPAAAGPHPLTLLAILAAGAMVAFSIRESGTPPAPPAPAPVVGLDLRGRFVGPDAATDAATTAAPARRAGRRDRLRRAAGRAPAPHRGRVR